MGLPDANCCNAFFNYEASQCNTVVLYTFINTREWRWTQIQANASHILENCPQKQNIIIPLCCGGVVTIPRGVSK